MAILQGHIPFTGRVGDVVYYYVGNEIWCRTICPNIRKRVMKEERYALFRVYSGLFRQSSKLASLIYRQLGIKDDRFYRSIVGEAMKLFKCTSMKAEEVMDTLWRKYIEPVEEHSTTTISDPSKPALAIRPGRSPRTVTLKTGPARPVKRARSISGDSLFKTFSKHGKNRRRVAEKTETNKKAISDDKLVTKSKDDMIQGTGRLRKTTVAINVKWKQNVAEEEKMSYKRSCISTSVY